MEQVELMTLRKIIIEVVVIASRMRRNTDRELYYVDLYSDDWFVNIHRGDCGDVIVKIRREFSGDVVIQFFYNKRRKFLSIHESLNGGAYCKREIIDAFEELFITDENDKLIVGECFG